MASFNKVILIGNLTADPELRQTANGTSVCRFTLAVNRRFRNTGDQNQQNADFITVVAWKERAEFVSKYFRKGRPILVCGQIQSRSWSDQSGQKRYATEVVADEVTFVENKNDGAAPSGNAPYTPDAYTGGTGAPAFSTSGSDTGSFEETTDDSDLPF
ncbi:MAG: single-stranded DNA-binding protein [Clostridia bacterium]|nr:single-stranded DNA-binding protein [Clostridia bacterium]MDY6185327.1 single-stranded DNA-binding protein [Eubacteriales bacterium]